MGLRLTLATADGDTRAMSNTVISGNPGGWWRMSCLKEWALAA